MQPTTKSDSAIQKKNKKLCERKPRGNAKKNQTKILVD